LILLRSWRRLGIGTVKQLVADGFFVAAVCVEVE